MTNYISEAVHMFNQGSHGYQIVDFLQRNKPEATKLSLAVIMLNKRLSEGTKPLPEVE